MGSRSTSAIGYAVALGPPFVAVAVPLTVASTLMVLARRAIARRWSRSGGAAEPVKPDREARLLIARVAVGYVLTVYGNLFAADRIGLGPVAALVAGVTLLYGARDFWSMRKTRWALIQGAAGLISLLGLGMVVWSGDAAGGGFVGTVVALILAVVTLNYMEAMNRLKDKGLAWTGTIQANNWSLIVLIPVACWIEGIHWLWDLDVIFKGLGSGALFGVGALLTIGSYERLTPTVQGVIYTLRTPISAVVGVIGYQIGKLPASQVPTRTAAAGIGLVFLAALIAALARDPRANAGSRRPGVDLTKKVGLTKQVGPTGKKVDLTMKKVDLTKHAAGGG